MDYKKHYDLLVQKCAHRDLQDQYYETHHIIPKCLGGTNEKDNLVKMLPEEHFVAHLLLAKMYPRNAKLLYAVVKLTGRSASQVNRPSNNKLYGWIKRRLSVDTIKRNKTLRWYTNGTINMKFIPGAQPDGFIEGRTITQELSNKLAALRGVKWSEERRLQHKKKHKQSILIDGVAYDSIILACRSLRVGYPRLMFIEINECGQKVYTIKPKDKSHHERQKKLIDVGDGVIIRGISAAAEYLNKSRSFVDTRLQSGVFKYV